MSVIQTLWQRLGPAASRTSLKDLIRSCLGAGLGLALAGMLVGMVDHFLPHALFLFAPLGATAVLVFAMPSSPLAQPWNCVVGNTVPALYSLLLLWAFPTLSLTSMAALAVAGAIAIMLALRALHPPGGAVALLTVLSAEQLLPLGWHLLVPMAALSAVLVAVGVLYHRACGRPYLHQPPQVAKARRPATQLALSEQDLEQLLQRFDQSNNLSPEDLGVMLAAAEEDAIKRRMSAVSCGEVMSAKLLTVSPQTPLEEIAELFHRHLVKCLPVVDTQGELIGRVLRADLFDWLWQGHRARQQQNLWQRLRAKPSKEQSVAQDLMRGPEMSVQEATPMGDLLQELASHTVQFIAVQRGKTLVGVITRSDVIRTLLSVNH
ncbi:HPP family protein [Comamonas sp. Y33R10-2]|uniref:HPP family protein n=1 Tax=Comamonas sp. Y33R10-2 TaxID=2853257 RepID=UPI00210258FB|nr:HPP family protein [Comamonas sp. Y33R10-2]